MSVYKQEGDILYDMATRTKEVAVKQALADGASALAKISPLTAEYDGHCKVCGALIQPKPFCPYCGQAYKWEGLW